MWRPATQSDTLYMLNVQWQGSRAQTLRRAGGCELNHSPDGVCAPCVRRGHASPLAGTACEHDAYLYALMRACILAIVHECMQLYL